MGNQEDIKLAHKLEVKRIIIEKIIFGLILVVAAFLGNLLLEKYKSREIVNRYFTEQRYKVSIEILESHSITTKSLYSVFKKACTKDSIDNDELERIIKNADEFAHTYNKHSVLFASEYENIVHRVYNIHKAFVMPPTNIKCEHRDFLNSITEYFESAILKEIGDISKRGSGFSLIKISKSELDRLGIQNYLQNNLKAWRIEKINSRNQTYQV